MAGALETGAGEVVVGAAALVEGAALVAGGALVAPAPGMLMVTPAARQRFLAKVSAAVDELGMAGARM